jgi:diamine N-acetyltransferase
MREQLATAATSQPTINIVGERLVLGPLNRDLIDTYWRWLNDFRMTRTIGVPLPYPWEQVEGEFRQISDNATSTEFTICEKVSGRPIGNVAWRDIDWRNGTAEYVLFIGEGDCRGKGYGTEVTRLMLDYAFNTLGLDNVMLRVYEFNVAGHRAYLKAGFRECGRRRQCKRLGGKLWDVIYMECLAADFLGAHG